VAIPLLISVVAFMFLFPLLQMDQQPSPTILSPAMLLLLGVVVLISVYTMILTRQIYITTSSMVILHLPVVMTEMIYM